MMIFEFIVLNSIITVLAVYALFLKIDIFKIVGYEIQVDILFTIFLAWFMMNTFNGILTATLSGLLLSIILRFTRWYFGYKKYEHGQWVYYAREGILGEHT